MFLNSIEKELPIATLAPNHAVAPAPITLSVNRPSGTITISEPHTNGTKSESVAELFDRSGSAKPLGGATVAVFTSGVVTLALTVRVVPLLPGGIVPSAGCTRIDGGAHADQPLTVICCGRGMPVGSGVMASVTPLECAIVLTVPAGA